jgi:hypothetical protein
MIKASIRAGTAALPWATITARSAAAVPAAGGGWRAALRALWAPGGASEVVRMAAASLSAVLDRLAGPPATAAAAVGGAGAAPLAAHGATALALAPIAGVLAAVDSAVALTGQAAGAAAIPGLAGPAAIRAAVAAGAANGVVVPMSETFPGVGTHGRFRIATATVQAALEGDLGGVAAAAATSGAHATIASALPWSGKVAYSYGVDGVTLAHPYPTAPGAYGHAHPHAVIEYAGRGWVERRNTSTNAWQAAQPDPFPAAGGAVGGGHAALGWENVAGLAPYEGKIRGNAFDVTCLLCGAVRFTP